MNVHSAGSPGSRFHPLPALIGWLLLSLAAAALGGLFPPGDWYAQLNKPSWHPPNWIFGPVWTALYILMAVAAWLVWWRGGFAGQSQALGLYLLQILLNALWTPLFFGLHHPALAFAEIILLWVALLSTVLVFWKTHRLAGALLIPYLAWVTFAAVLNFSLWRLNRQDGFH